VCWRSTAASGWRLFNSFPRTATQSSAYSSNAKQRRRDHHQRRQANQSNLARHATEPGPPRISRCSEAAGTGEKGQQDRRFLSGGCQGSHLAISMDTSLLELPILHAWSHREHPIHHGCNLRAPPIPIPYMSTPALARLLLLLCSLRPPACRARAAGRRVLAIRPSTGGGSRTNQGHKRSEQFQNAGWLSDKARAKSSIQMRVKIRYH
jgi:hypothetical protein